MIRRLAIPSIPVILFLAYVLLGIAWVFAKPPEASTDEPSQYRRALGVASGELTGSPVPPVPGLTGVAQFQQETNREFTVPGDLISSTDLGTCTILHTNLPASCMKETDESGTVGVISYQGTYEPLPFVVPGLFALRGHDALSGMWLGRIGALTIFLALVAAGIAALWLPSRPQVVVVGSVLSLTPMVLFVGSSINASAMELGSAFCFSAAIVRLALFAKEPHQQFTLLAAAVSGAFFINSRPDGLPFLALLLIAGLLAGGRNIIATIKTHRRYAIAAATILAISGGAELLWRHVAGTPKAAGSVAAALPAIPAIFNQMVESSSQMVGVFGRLDVDLPGLAYPLWLALIVAVLTIAAIAGTRSTRRLIIGVVAGFVVAEFFIAFSLAVEIAPGVMQGRYALPIGLIVPLLGAGLAGKYWHRLGKLAPSRLAAYLCGTVAVIQFAGWYATALRYAVGIRGRKLFFLSPQWSPPLGWTVWLVLVTVGCCLIACAGILASRATRLTLSTAS